MQTQKVLRPRWDGRGARAASNTGRRRQLSLARLTLRNADLRRRAKQVALHTRKSKTAKADATWLSTFPAGSHSREANRSLTAKYPGGGLPSILQNKAKRGRGQRRAWQPTRLVASPRVCSSRPARLQPVAAMRQWLHRERRRQSSARSQRPEWQWLGLRRPRFVGWHEADLCQTRPQVASVPRSCERCRGTDTPARAGSLTWMLVRKYWSGRADQQLQRFPLSHTNLQLADAG